MRKSLVVGILRETKPGEFRASLSPFDVAWLRKRGIDIEVESDPQRIFKDSAYKKAGAKIIKRFQKATLLVGIKEPEPANLYSDKVYMVFSHSIKGQAGSIPLLKECIKKGITLVDYEKITDVQGKRLVYFGKFAGICGFVDSLYYLGKKLEWKGIDNPFTMIRPASKYRSFNALKSDIMKMSARISKRGFNEKISPFILGITGHGHVREGVWEVLKLLNPIEIHPRDMEKFVHHQKHINNRIYKIVLHREEKFRSKTGINFYYEEYFKKPENFESNLDLYLPHLNLLIHTSYWDKRYPRLVTKKMIDDLYKKRFRLGFIGDISCDIHGSIELTNKATTIDNPTYTYNPVDGSYIDGYKSEGVTIMARDNLPTEMPKIASNDFSGLVREYVYQIAAHGITDITNHIAIPREIRQAVIIQDKKLTAPYEYLKEFM